MDKIGLLQPLIGLYPPIGLFEPDFKMETRKLEE
jgi:hypothetical protein